MVLGGWFPTSSVVVLRSMFRTTDASEMIWIHTRADAANVMTFKTIWHRAVRLTIRIGVRRYISTTTPTTYRPKIAVPAAVQTALPQMATRDRINYPVGIKPNVGGQKKTGTLRCCKRNPMCGSMEMPTAGAPFRTRLTGIDADRNDPSPFTSRITEGEGINQVNGRKLPGLDSNQKPGD